MESKNISPVPAASGEVPPRIWVLVDEHNALAFTALEKEEIQNPETKEELIPYVPESALSSARAEAKSEAFEEAAKEFRFWVACNERERAECYGIAADRMSSLAKQSAKEEA